MADIRVQREKRSGQMTWLWMLVALVAVAGLMAWLVVQTRQAPVAVQEVEDPDAQADAALPAVSFTALSNAREYMGQEIRVTDVPVSSRLGEQAFWAELPGGVPYLVRLSPAARETMGQPQSGQVVTVVGEVHTMSDSVLTAWEQAGPLRDEGQRAEASFATTFLEALRVSRVQ